MDDNNLNYLVTSILDKLSSQKKTLANSISSTEYYRGTTMADMLLQNKKLKVSLKHGNYKCIPLAFIVNTIHSTNATNVMGHWLTLIIHHIPQKNVLIIRYFDSFGSRHDKYKHVGQYINNIKSRCKIYGIRFELDRLTRSLQHYDSKLCGLYAAFAIVSAYVAKNTLSLKKMFSHFKGDGLKNDLRVQKFLYDNYPSSYCHDNPIYSNMKVSLSRLRVGNHPPPFCPKKTLGLPSCFNKCKCVNDGAC